MKAKIKKYLKVLGISLVLIFALWGVYTACAIYAIITMPLITDPYF